MFSILPKYGLSGGDGMRFEPGSMLLFIDHEPDAFRLFSMTPNPLAVDQHPFDEIARFMHERDHLLRHLTTSTGLLRHALMSQIVCNAMELVDVADIDVLCEFDGLASRRSHPVFALVQEARGDLDALSRDCKAWSPADKHLLRYLARLELLRTLDGDSCYCNPSLSEWGLAYLESGMITGFPGFKNQMGTYARTWQNGESPEVHPKIGDWRLTSRSIFEAFGFETELVYANRRGRGLNESTDLQAHGEYRLCAAIFEQRFRKRLQFGRVPLEFDAMLDLALWIPLTLGGTFVPKSAHTWCDLEPGYRFSKAMDWAIKHKIEFTYGEDKNFEACDRAVLQFQERICDAMGWPTPSRLCEMWIDQLQNCIRSEMVPSTLLQFADTHPRLEWSLHLLRERKDRPFSFYHRDFREVMKIAPAMFPGVVFPKVDIAYGDAHSGLGAFRDHQILTTARLLIEGIQNHSHILRSHVDEGLVLLEQLSREFLGPSPDRENRYRKLREALPNWLPANAPRERSLVRKNSANVVPWDDSEC